MPRITARDLRADANSTDPHSFQASIPDFRYRDYKCERRYPPELWTGLRTLLDAVRQSLFQRRPRRGLAALLCGIRKRYWPAHHDQQLERRRNLQRSARNFAAQFLHPHRVGRLHALRQAAAAPDAAHSSVRKRKTKPRPPQFRDAWAILTTYLSGRHVN